MAALLDSAAAGFLLGKRFEFPVAEIPNGYDLWKAYSPVSRVGPSQGFPNGPTIKSATTRKKKTNGNAALTLMLMSDNPMQNNLMQIYLTRLKLNRVYFTQFA